MALLTETLSADGQSAEATWGGGEGIFSAYGTFGGGTAKLQVEFENSGTWLDVDTSNLSFTSDGHGSFTLPEGVQLRVDLSESTSPSISVFIGSTARV
jgi:hypothetical protein